MSIGCWSSRAQILWRQSALGARRRPPTPPVREHGRPGRRMWVGLLQPALAGCRRVSQVGDPERILVTATARCQTGRLQPPGAPPNGVRAARKLTVFLDKVTCAPADVGCAPPGPPARSLPAALHVQTQCVESWSGAGGVQTRGVPVARAWRRRLAALENTRHQRAARHQRRRHSPGHPVPPDHSKTLFATVPTGAHLGITAVRHREGRWEARGYDPWYLHTRSQPFQRCSTHPTRGAAPRCWACCWESRSSRSRRSLRPRTRT